MVVGCVRLVVGLCGGLLALGVWSLVVGLVVCLACALLRRVGLVGVLGFVGRWVCSAGGGFVKGCVWGWL